ncbi:MAG: MBL fold metallo-hydrolase [Clostridia bacterium]|nr:MBL fold metallo-hydrolase [Clostridia bacterium]
MFIEYLGHSSFFIAGEEYSVVTDPFSGIGYSVRRVKADYCLISHEHFDHNYRQGVDADRILTKSEGRFKAVECFHDDAGGKKRGVNRMFFFTLDGVSFCHMGDIGEKPNAEIVEKIGSVDVLFIPIGGRYTINAIEAKEYIDAIKPKIAIPMHYKTPLSNIDISGIEGFYKLFDTVKVGCEKIVFTKEDIPKATEICVLGALKHPEYTDEQLKRANIHDLRVIVRKVGLAPGSGNKERLIGQIVDIRDHKTATMRNAKGRRAHDNWGGDEAVGPMIMPDKSEERLAEPEISEVGKAEFIVERTFNGKFKCSDAESFADLEIEIPEAIAEEWDIKAGDKISGRAEKNRFTGVAAIKNIYGVEGTTGGERPNGDFESQKSSYPDERVLLRGRKSAAINLFSPIGKGQKTLVKLPYAYDENYIAEQIASAFSDEKAKCVYLAVNARREDVDAIAGYESTEVAFTDITGAAGEAERLCRLVPERAKRIVEGGEDCVVIVNGVDALLENGDKGDGAVKGLLLAAKNVKEKNSLTVVIISHSEKIKEYRQFCNSYIEMDDRGYNFLESYTKRADLMLPKRQFEAAEKARAALFEGNEGLARFLRNYSDGDEKRLISGIEEMSGRE